MASVTMARHVMLLRNVLVENVVRTCVNVSIIVKHKVLSTDKYVECNVNTIAIENLIKLNIIVLCNTTCLTQLRLANL